MMKKPCEMTFEEFAISVKPSASINRLPEVDNGMPVYSYSVYLNGPVADELPESYKKVEFADVMVIALTNQLKMDSENFRNNLRVCEMVAVRRAWMDSVCTENTRNVIWGLEELPEAVLNDYAILSKGMGRGMDHPYIQQELNKQKVLSANLGSMLDALSKVAGRTLLDMPSKEISVGLVVSQTLDFTVQKTNDGEVVTHENSRLSKLPMVGSDVSVFYYRGNGQVVDSLENLKVSEPFIETTSGDLAVIMTDNSGVEQCVLFNNVLGFDKFVKAHGLSNDLTRRAVDVWVESPKKVVVVPKRELVGAVYIEQYSGCLAIDYKEGEKAFSAMFGSEATLIEQGRAYGMTEVHFKQASALTAMQAEQQNIRADVSFKKLLSDLSGQGISVPVNSVQNNIVYAGKVIGEAALHVAQDVGRGGVVIHDKRNLDKIPAKDNLLIVKYVEGFGRVSSLDKSAGFER